MEMSLLNGFDWIASAQRFSIPALMVWEPVTYETDPFTSGIRCSLW
jgi:hypothetical protein